MVRFEYDQTPHCCRHTCVSLLATAQVSQTYQKLIVGHKGAMSITESVYTHIEMSELIKYVDTAEGRYSLDDPWCSNLYVLTNKSRINGAAGIMYEGVLKKLADKLESDMYILPSSIHEVIILPKSTMFNKEELMAMVRDVNTEGVSKDEVLSYTVYEYDRNTEELYS